MSLPHVGVLVIEKNGISRVKKHGRRFWPSYFLSAITGQRANSLFSKECSYDLFR